MKLEIYQIGKVTPIVLECDSWFIDCGNTPKINTYKDRKRNAVFFVNNIAGFKEISEDDELKEATTEAIREFSKAVIDGIDEGYISHSSDMVDFTHNYLNVKSELKGEALEREQNG